MSGWMVKQALGTPGVLLVLALAGCVQQPSFKWTGDAAALDGVDGTFLMVNPWSIPGTFQSLTQFTIEAYVRPDPASGGQERFIIDANDHALAMSIDGAGRIKCRWSDDPLAGEVLVSQNKVMDGTWHHVACVRHIETDLTRKVAVFIDGMVEDAVVDPAPTAGLVAVTSICIGSSVDQTNAFFGLLDEVKVYLEPALEHARDFDGDGILDVVDNCPGTANYGQADGNGDRVGDACTDRTGTPCPDATACDDGNPCTTDACANGTCSCAPATGECNDFDPFTSQDKCTDGQCAGVRSDLTVTARRA